MSIITNVLQEIKSSDKTGFYSMTANVVRSIETAEVIDYDGYNGNYALFWKKISINFSQGWSKKKTMVPFHLDNVYYNNPWDDVIYDKAMKYTGPEQITTKAVRTVNYYLSYKIDKKIDRLLATCTMETDSIEDLVFLTSDYQIKSLAGNRIYGTSLQVDNKHIVYTHELGQVAEKPDWIGLHGYDGNYSFENWNEDASGKPLWTFDKRVVGIINIADGISDVGYLYEQVYDVMDSKNLLSPTVYGVGSVNK